MTQDLAPTTHSPLVPREKQEEKHSPQAALARLDRVAKLMDAQFELPLIKTKIGLDPILGLAPGAGDWITGAVSIYLLWQASRLKAPPLLLARMAGNIGVDILGGYVPVVGDLFDLAYKANTKNMKLLRDHLDPLGQLNLPHAHAGQMVVPEGSSRASRMAMMVALTLILAALASGPIVLLYLVFGQP